MRRLKRKGGGGDEDNAQKGDFSGKTSLWLPILRWNIYVLDHVTPSDIWSAPTYLSLCHRSSFNPWCDVSGIFFLKTFYVSLIYKCRIVFKIFTEPFLSNTLPWRGEISNISNRQTKYAWKYVITLLILLSQPYAPQETNIYKAGMLLCTRRVCIL